jgi:hypothetical protein
MVLRRVIALYYEIHMKYVNILHEKNEEYLNVKAGGHTGLDTAVLYKVKSKTLLQSNGVMVMYQ